MKLSVKFENNSYPPSLVKRVISKTLHTVNGKKNKDKAQTTMTLPYMGKVSNQLSKIPKKKNCRLLYTNNGTLAGMFSSNYKYRTTKDTNVVYSIPCTCGEIYVGETSKSLSTRVAQHKYAVRSDNENNGIACHVMLSGHTINWEEAKILDREIHWKKRKILEALFIRKLNPGMNLNKGFSLKIKWDRDYLA